MDKVRFVTSITNPCGNGPTLEEYAAKLLKQAAGVAAPEDDGKKCNEQGQKASADPADEFQKGESCGCEKKEEKEAATTKPVKEAAGTAKAEDSKDGVVISLPADTEFQKGESEDGSKVTPENKKTTVDGKKAPKADKADAKSEPKKEEKEDKKEDKKEASASKWTKISNLNPKEKQMLKKYWLGLFPREYVDSMVQDR